MTEKFDFVVVGSGSAGAILAARLTEDETVRVCLLEAGGEPPAAALIPAACASLQHNPAADWEYTGDGGEGTCLGLSPAGRMHVPRGKMLGGSSSINYCAFVRGHPGDFDEWARNGADGWSYADVLPYFKKLETFNDPTHVRKGDIVVDEAAHGKTGPLNVSIRNPTLPATDVFLEACKSQGLPLLDYNGITRGGPKGGVSHTQFSTKQGKRHSSYRAYLEPVMKRKNLKVITGAMVARIRFEGTRATGAEYQDDSGRSLVASATKEVLLSAGSIQTPAILLRSGIGPKADLEKLSVPCVLDKPHVGKHLKDHLMFCFIYPAPGLGKSVLDVFSSLGSDALKGVGVLPTDENSYDADQKAMKVDADKQITDLMVEGRGLAGSSLYDAVAFWNTGLGDEHSHDAQLALMNCGYNKEVWGGLFSYDIDKYFGSPDSADLLMGPTSQNIFLVAHIVKPRSEGEVSLASTDVQAQPDIRFNYLSDPEGHDLKVAKSVMKRTLQIGKAMKGIRPVFMPKILREKHNYKEGGEASDAFLEDYARHFPLTVYHASASCRMGDVLDSRLRVQGIDGLRVADASAMPNIVSGNTNAACLMIGEKAAEMIAREHKVKLNEFADTFDFVVVGAGSAGAIVATRLSEDPKVRICLLEAGGEPPSAALIPAACASLQHNPAADWEYSGDAGSGQLAHPGVALGLSPPGRMHCPRGKMLGGSSSINYCAFVRGHPGDFDEWAWSGAPGWSYKDVLPYFKKLETFNDPKHVKRGGIVVDDSAHGKTGPLNVSIRNPILPATDVFLEACKANGLPLIDYNGSTRGGPSGGVSHTHFSTKDGKRHSSYRAFLEQAMGRPNLKVITGALTRRITLDGLRAVGAEYQSESGEISIARATKEVVLSGGAIHSPAILLRSGIGPKAELQATTGKACLLDSAHVGKHLKDHLMALFIYPAPGLGKSVLEVFTALGSDALKGVGVLPEDETSYSKEQKAMKDDSDRQIMELMTEGKGLASSSLYDGLAFWNTGLGDEHTHDAQLALMNCAYNKEVWSGLFSYDIDKYFGSADGADELMGPTSQNIMLVAHIVKPHSEGEVRLSSDDAMAQPDIRFNYFSDSEGHDMKVFKSVSRRVLQIGKAMKGIGAVYLPQNLRSKHKHKDGDEVTDALLEDYAKHFTVTVYHACATCRMGDVLDSQLRVKGVENLRVADASAMPNIVSGNTNAASLMIGEKAAEIIARDHTVALKEFVDTYDFLVVGAGSAGAIVASRLSEDPKVRVCLLEAGGEPPAAALIPAACASLQHNPAADWEYSGDAGKGQCAGLSPPGRMHVPRGKCLGGSSSINYCAFVRGHPGDFDDWAKNGAPGWSFGEVLPYFKKLECFSDPKHVKDGGIVVDKAAHGKSGPLHVSVRNPTLLATDVFLDACKSNGLPLIDYNGLTRGGSVGGVSHTHFSTKDGKRHSSHRAFLEPIMERTNLKVITGALTSRVVLEGLKAVGVEYQVEGAGTRIARASKEVVLSAGVFSSPAILMRSGIGPKAEVDQIWKGMPCVLDMPHVGKHLKDHLMGLFIYPAPGLGKSVLEVFTSLGSDALKAVGVLPADESSYSDQQKALKENADRQLIELMTEGKGLASSSLYDAVGFWNTGLGDDYSHDAQLALMNCAYNKDVWSGLFSYDVAKYFGSPESADELMAPTSQNIMLVAHIVKPHSEGEVLLHSSDPAAKPDIRFNYFSDPQGHDIDVFKSVARRALQIGKAMRGVGPVYMPEILRKKHNCAEGDEVTDAFLEDYARHFPVTVYHGTSTCRIGDVLDSRLRVQGIDRLRIADASAMPNIVSGNTNAAALMIGEKAAEIIARDHKVNLNEFVDKQMRVTPSQAVFARGPSSEQTGCLQKCVIS